MYRQLLKGYEVYHSLEAVVEKYFFRAASEVMGSTEKSPLKMQVTLHFLSLLLVVSAGQQYFRVQPHDTKVQEGGEAMLECEVAMLAGAVQWTKDGFALEELSSEELR
ncbi:hypothetical protein D910_01819 [Dendroctonus ponderosae]|uniref:Ig-like domain-containing protein n=1 Tax=Dendroctonus ponderosae TaxID=77166 RepID=U4TSC5_DENPD|nr:hypothetical protein D910_01819 [Dendroctonus ponderosae]